MVKRRAKNTKLNKQLADFYGALSRWSEFGNDILTWHIKKAVAKKFNCIFLGL